MADTTSLQWLIDAVDKMRQNRTMQNPALAGQPQSMQNYLGDIGTQNAMRAPQQPAYNPAIPIAPRNFNTAGANVNPAATNTVANYPSSTPIPIRSTIEGIYGKGSVNYDPATGTIYLFDRRTGRTGTIPVGTYSLQNDTAYINPDYIRSWLNPQTVAPQERLNTEPPYQPYLEASSPGFRNMVNLVKAWQEANPVYVPFPAGTPTLERQKFDEAKRQFEETQRQAEEKAKADRALDWARLYYRTPLEQMKDAAAKRWMAGQATDEDLALLGIKTTDTYTPDDAATNAAIAQAMTYPSAEAAYKALSEIDPKTNMTNAEAMAARGVDINKVIDAIQNRWQYSGGSTSGTGFLGIPTK